MPPSVEQDLRAVTRSLTLGVLARKLSSPHKGLSPMPRRIKSECNNLELVQQARRAGAPQLSRQRAGQGGALAPIGEQLAACRGASTPAVAPLPWNHPLVWLVLLGGISERASAGLVQPVAPAPGPSWVPAPAGIAVAPTGATVPPLYQATAATLAGAVDAFRAHPSCASRAGLRDAIEASQGTLPDALPLAEALGQVDAAVVAATDLRSMVDQKDTPAMADLLRDASSPYANGYSEAQSVWRARRAVLAALADAICAPDTQAMPDQALASVVIALEARLSAETAFLRSVHLAPACLSVCDQRVRQAEAGLDLTRPVAQLRDALAARPTPDNIEVPAFDGILPVLSPVSDYLADPSAKKALAVVQAVHASEAFSTGGGYRFVAPILADLVARRADPRLANLLVETPLGDAYERLGDTQALDSLLLTQMATLHWVVQDDLGPGAARDQACQDLRAAWQDQRDREITTWRRLAGSVSKNAPSKAFLAATRQRYSADPTFTACGAVSWLRAPAPSNVAQLPEAARAILQGTVLRADAVTSQRFADAVSAGLAHPDAVAPLAFSFHNLGATLPKTSAVGVQAADAGQTAEASYLQALQLASPEASALFNPAIAMDLRTRIAWAQLFSVPASTSGKNAPVVNLADWRRLCGSAAALPADVAASVAAHLKAVGWPQSGLAQDEPLLRLPGVAGAFAHPVAVTLGRLDLPPTWRNALRRDWTADPSASGRVDAQTVAALLVLRLFETDGNAYPPSYRALVADTPLSQRVTLNMPWEFRAPALASSACDVADSVWRDAASRLRYNAAAGLWETKQAHENKARWRAVRNTPLDAIELPGLGKLTNWLGDVVQKTAIWG